MDMKRRPPLWWALVYRRFATAQLLIRHGADLNLELEDGHLLSTYIYNGLDLPTLELMLDYGANPNCADRIGNTPLINAIQKDDPAMVRRLLRYHADPNQRLVSRFQPTVLEYAEKRQQKEIAKLLREAGAKR